MLLAWLIDGCNLCHFGLNIASLERISFTTFSLLHYGCKIDFIPLEISFVPVYQTDRCLDNTKASPRRRGPFGARPLGSLLTTNTKPSPRRRADVSRSSPVFLVRSDGRLIEADNLRRSFHDACCRGNDGAAYPQVRGVRTVGRYSASHKPVF